jgi:hypothetical protein
MTGIHPGTSAPARVDPDESDFWTDLREELDLWRAGGRRATFLWRDDDATMPSPALDRLLDLSATRGIPFALATIPARLARTLPARLAGAPLARVCQHGFAHVDWARRPGRGAWELGLDRPAERVLDDLARGRALLEGAFGARFLSLLAPPWNRIAEALLPSLPRVGFAAVSCAGPRARAEAAPGLAQANIHWDLVDWKRGRRFRGEDAAGQIVEHLRARRLGAADPGEPTGILTHHLAMDEEAWRFLRRFLAATARHDGASWCDPAALCGRPR